MLQAQSTGCSYAWSRDDHGPVIGPRGQICDIRRDGYAAGVVLLEAVAVNQLPPDPVVAATV